MTNRLAVGTPVNVKGFVYAEHVGRNDLVVLNPRENGGYGIGPKGNDAERPHDGDHGWLFYTANEVTPKTIEKESSTVTKFKVGDKVEVFQNGFTAPAWVGVKGIVKEVLSYGYRVELTNVAKSGERVGYRARLNGDNLKLIEEPKPFTFKVGDRVEFIEHFMGAATTGTQATVTHTTSGGTYTTVKTDDGEEYTPYSRRLKLVEAPKPFTFKDIQVGDTIRRTLTRKSGAKEVREGTVSQVASWYAEDEGYLLAYDTDTAEAEDVTLELLNRPEPKPTLLENTKKGDRLVLAKTSGHTKVYTKGKNDQWETLIIKPDGGSYLGAMWSSKELEQLSAGSGTKTYKLIVK